MVIRSTGFAGARSIFAEVRLPTGSKNAFLADLPPGSPGRGERQIRPGGFVGGSQDPHAVNVQSVTEHLQFFFPYPVICQEETGSQKNGCEADG